MSFSLLARELCSGWRRSGQRCRHAIEIHVANAGEKLADSTAHLKAKTNAEEAEGKRKGRGGEQRPKRVPFGNDNKKNKGNGNDKRSKGNGNDAMRELLRGLNWKGISWLIVSLNR
jgi:hypothetical protein